MYKRIMKITAWLKNQGLLKLFTISYLCGMNKMQFLSVTGLRGEELR